MFQNVKRKNIIQMTLLPFELFKVFYVQKASFDE